MLLGAVGGLTERHLCRSFRAHGGSQQLQVLHRHSRLRQINPRCSTDTNYRHRSRCRTTASLQTPDKQPSSNGGRMSQLMPKLAVAAVLLTAASAAYYVFAVQHLTLKDIAANLDSIVRSYGPYGPFIFIAAYVAATLVLIPATALTLAAGYLFGPGFGTFWASLAATVGATLAFLISRYLAQPFAKAKLQSYPKLASIEEQVSAEGIKLVFLLRLAPLVPFTVLNYALGITDVSLASYVFATWLGKLPGLFSQVYLGSTGRSIDAATSSQGVDKVSLALNIVGVVASILVTKLLADKASVVLQNETDNRS